MSWIGRTGSICFHSLFREGYDAVQEALSFVEAGVILLLSLLHPSASTPFGLSIAQNMPNGAQLSETSELLFYTLECQQLL